LFSDITGGEGVITAACAQGNRGWLPSGARRVYAEVMTKAEEYRTLAEEAQRRADALEESEAKRMYKQLADSWRDLAEQTVRNGR